MQSGSRYENSRSLWEDLIYERHRHRYEFNNEYRQQLTDAGLVISGTSPDGRLVESIEEKIIHSLLVHKHPELKSRPNNAHPLFRGFVDAILELKIVRKRRKMLRNEHLSLFDTSKKVGKIYR